MSSAATTDAVARARPHLDTDSAVVGAGPYGLSVAAHLLAAGVPTVVIGRPMESWQAMPCGMYLRSAWSASSLAAPGGRYCLDQYVQTTGARVQRPIPIEDFIDYGLWFRRQVVPDVQETYLRMLDTDGSAFTLQLEDGRTLRAARVVLGTGMSAFANVPAFVQGLPGELVTHSQQHRDFSAFFQKTVAVVGGGQSALECAALLHEAGASVELLVRREVIWLRFHDSASLTRKLIHAPSDVGPPGLSWLIHFGGLFRLLPDSLRETVARRATRPAGARWLVNRVVGRVGVTEHVEVVHAAARGERLRLRLSDGSERTVDHLLLATGYRPHLDRLRFLSPTIRERLRDHNGFPALDRSFESSIRGLHFVGRLADQSYGPICRFVSGAEPTARRVLAAVRRAA